MSVADVFGRRGLRFWVLGLVVVCSASIQTAWSQEGRFSASLGASVVGDPDDPLEGDTAIEASFWYVINRRVDIGVRAGQASFESMGAPGSPPLVAGELDLTPVELAARFYPTGSDRTVFGLRGISVATLVDDTFDSVPQGAPAPVGAVLDTTMEVDSVGFGVEAGGRWDVTDSFFVEFGLRYLLLGAESRAQVVVDPVVVEERLVDTNLDSHRIGVHFGIYF